MTTRLNVSDDMYTAKEAAKKIGWDYWKLIHGIRNGSVIAENLSKGDERPRWYISEEEIFRLKRGLPKVIDEMTPKGMCTISREEFLAARIPAPVVQDQEEDISEDTEPHKGFGEERSKLMPTREQAEILKLKARVKTLTSELMDILVQLDELTK